MDRLRDLASRNRASVPSFSFSSPLLQRKTADDDATSTMSSFSTASEPIHSITSVPPHFDPQPTQSVRSSQVTAQPQAAQDQAKPASDTELSKSKKKTTVKKKKDKSAMRRAFMERRKAEKQLLEMAEAITSQNDIIADSGQVLNRRLNNVARDILDAEDCIKRKDKEINEITEKLKTMEAAYSEAKKHLDKAQRLALDAIDNGAGAQYMRDMEISYLQNLKVMVGDMEKENVGNWSKEKTNHFLKVCFFFFFILLFKLFHPLTTALG